MSSARDRLRKLTDRFGGGAATVSPLRLARDLIDDLVARNLWPVALLLCVAIVAIPVVLSRGGDDAVGAPAPTPAAQVDVTATNAIELVGPPTIKSRPGTQLDPFRHPKKKEAPVKDVAAPGGATPSAVAPAASPAAAASPSAGAPSAGAPSTGTPSTGATPMVDPASVYYRTEVRWSLAQSSPARPISRLTPLGDVGERGVLYLGVSNRGYAMFLLSPNAQIEVGDDEPGKLKLACVETTNCRLIALKTGASQVVMVPPADGGKARRYHLQVVSAKRVVTTVAAARTMRAKEHSEGRVLLRELASDPLAAQVLDLIRYDVASGLLVLASADKKTSK